MIVGIVGEAMLQVPTAGPSFRPPILDVGDKLPQRVNGQLLAAAEHLYDGPGIVQPPRWMSMTPASIASPHSAGRKAKHHRSDRPHTTGRTPLARVLR